MTELTEAEAAVYDRQLRVWGVEMQKRLRSARVLIVGCTGISAEVAKNIVLAGVGQLHLVDDTPSTDAADTNFLNCPTSSSSSVAEVSARSLTEMNPMVSTSARPGPANPTKELLQGYDIVLIVNQPLGSLVLWDALCRENHIGFFAAVSRGSHAFFFVDLGEHSYQPPEIAGKAQAVESKHYHSLIEALQLSSTSIHPTKTPKLLPVILLCAAKEGEVEGFLKPEETADLMVFWQNLAKAQGALPKTLDRATLEDYLHSHNELAPVNSIVGGVLANELLKAVSKKGEPFDNLFIYSMADGGGVIERLAPPAKKPKVMSALARQV